jgi:flagellar motor protein MotB
MKAHEPYQMFSGNCLKLAGCLLALSMIVTETGAGTTDAELEALEQQIEQQEKEQAEAKKRAAEEAKRKTEEEQLRMKEEAAKQKAEAEAKQKAEEDQLRAEKEQKQQLEEEIRRKIEEEQRLAIEEAKRKEEEANRLAEEEKAELAEHQRQQLMEESRLERQKRSARKQDNFGYVDDPAAQDLLQLDHKQKQINVFANIDKWQSSGVLIKKGNTYRITATGQWSLGGLCNPTGPDGVGIYSVTCWDLGGQTVAGFTHSALIGKIGKQNPAFFVGTEYQFTSEEEGVLYFMSNDAPGFFFDNSGSFVVTISAE